MFWANKLLRGVFGFQAVTTLGLTLFFAYGIGRKAIATHWFSAAAVDQNLALEQMSTILAGLLSCTALFAMAWWTTSSTKASARLWAMLASLLNFCGGAYIALESRGGMWLLLVIGVGGLVACTQKDIFRGPARSPGLPGDGTSWLFESLATILGFGAILFFVGPCLRWAHAQNLPVSRGAITFLLLLGLARLIATMVHECGHLSIAWSLGMRLRSFRVGPFDWRIRGGKWRFQFRLANLLVLDGAVGHAPVDLRDIRRHEIAVLVAGPLASLWLGWITLCGTLTAKAHPWERGWELLALIATLAFADVVVNLLPLRPAKVYSDGAQIYQWLSGGPWADVYRAWAMIASSTVTSLRPRLFDVELIQRAACFVKHGERGFLLRMFLYQYFYDAGRTLEALAALAQAEAIFDESPGLISPSLYPEFLFAHAFLRRDPTRAFLCYDRLSAVSKKLPRPFSADYWRALCAFYWLENRLPEALAAWEKGNAIVRNFPGSGGYELHRVYFEQLREALHASLACGSVGSRADKSAE